MDRPGDVHALTTSHLALPHSSPHPASASAVHAECRTNKVVETVRDARTVLSPPNVVECSTADEEGMHRTLHTKQTGRIAETSVWPVSPGPGDRVQRAAALESAIVLVGRRSACCSS